MAKLGILVTLGPFQFENWETAVNIAEAALDKGHDVRVFFYLEGIYNPNKYQTFPDMEVMPHRNKGRSQEPGVGAGARGNL